MTRFAGRGIDDEKIRKQTAKSDINVTPFIDILLVLLVIFMTINS
jgi:biopolymer transport protein ExbD